MSDAVIVGLITGGTTLLVNMFMYLSSFYKTRINQAKREATLDKQLEVLTTKVDKIEQIINKRGGII